MASVIALLASVGLIVGVFLLAGWLINQLLIPSGVARYARIALGLVAIVLLLSLLLGYLPIPVLRVRTL